LAVFKELYTDKKGIDNDACMLDYLKTNNYPDLSNFLFNYYSSGIYFSIWKRLENRI